MNLDQYVDKIAMERAARQYHVGDYRRCGATLVPLGSKIRPKIAGC